METLFELTFQDQTLNPQVGTFTDASQTTGTFTLEDGEYYLTNADSKGFYAYKPVAMQSGLVDDSKVIIEFDLKVVTASVNTHAIIGTYARVDGNGIPTGAKITLQYNNGDIELVLGSGTTATLIESADVVVDQWYHFRIDCMLAAPLASTYQVKIDGVSVTTVTGAATDYELGVISVLGTDLHSCDECGIKNITLVTETNMYVGRTALDQALQDVKGYVDSHNGVLTIQKNGTDIGTFSANQETNETINIVVPDVNNGTLTIQKNGTDIGTFSANQATDKTINIEVPDAFLPIGTYIQFAGSQAPDGFLVCNGGEISRTTYSALFAVIGTTYGSGDGSTTFNLPNLIGKFLEGGSSSGTVYEAGLPNITGSLCGHMNMYNSSTNGAIAYSTSGAFYDEKTYDQKVAQMSTTNFGGEYGPAIINASRSSDIYGKSATVQPNAITCLICIKY